MTIETEHRKAGPFISDGAQTVFPFNFRIFKKEDIVVTIGNDDLNNADNQILKLFSDYDVQFTEGEAEGNISFYIAPAAGKIIVITSDVPELQLTHLTNKGGMFPEVIETAFDKCVVLIQQLKEKIRRALIMPVTSTVSSPEEFLQNFINTAADISSAAEASANAAADSAGEAARSADDASSSAADAKAASASSAASAEEAYAWANTPEDEAVKSTSHPGEYSAYHFAQKAKRDFEANRSSHRGTYYNAFNAIGPSYEIDEVAIVDAGSGYSVGNIAVITISGTEYPAWVNIDAVDDAGAVTAVSLSSRGIFSTKPADSDYPTSSDGGSGLILAVTAKDGVPTTLRDIQNPMPNQTATVLHNERFGGTTWYFIYSDRNGDGVYNWVENIQAASQTGTDIPDDEQTITSEAGIRTLTAQVKNALASSVKVTGQNDMDIPRWNASKGEWEPVQGAGQNAGSSSSLVGQLFYGQIVLSAVPIDSDGLCLLNGQQLQKGGRHDKFISHIAGLKEAHPGLFVTETAWLATVMAHGSCGKFVLGDDSIRLPKISDILQCTTDMGACGDLVQAGLPNITGALDIYASNVPVGYVLGEKGALSSIRSVSQHGYITDIANTASRTGIMLNASLSSPVYGKSDTVQPQTLKVLAYIVVDAVDVDALNELLRTVNEKGEEGQVLVKGENGAVWGEAGADKDLSNITAKARHDIVASVMPVANKIELSMPASGNYIIAPDSGYIVAKLFGANTGWVSADVYCEQKNDGPNYLDSYIASHIADYGYGAFFLFFPVKKGNYIYFYHENATFTPAFILFKYAGGTQP